MAIPNSEVSYIYRNTIRTWFDKKRKTFDMSSLFTALDEGDTEQTGEEISGFPEESISENPHGQSHYSGAESSEKNSGYGGGLSGSPPADRGEKIPGRTGAGGIYGYSGIRDLFLPEITVVFQQLSGKSAGSSPL